MKIWDGVTAMHYAAMGGHTDVISFLLGHGEDAQCRDSEERTPLHFAVEYGHFSAVQVLLQALDEADRTAAVNSCDKGGDSVFISSAREGSVEFVKILHQAGGKMSQLGSNGETSLIAAARKGKQDVAEWLLNNFNTEWEGMSLQEYIDMEDKDGKNALCYTASEESMEFVTLLLQAGGMLSRVGWGKKTPLMIATIKGNIQVVEKLVKNFNAEREGMKLQEYIHLKDKNSNTVLHFAAWNGSVKCVKYLIKAGVKLSLVNEIGETPLMIAARKGNQKVVEYLLANLNARGESMEYIHQKNQLGNTVMHLSAGKGSVKCIERLLEAGGTLSSVNDNGETPLMKAALEGNQEVVKYLLENFTTGKEDMTAQEYIDTKDKKGNTVLHLAAWEGSVESVSHIVKAGGKLSILNKESETPLMIAARKGRQEVVEKLLDGFNAERELMPLQKYINYRSYKGNTALHNAAWSGSVEIVKLLLNAKGSLSQVGCNGETPLMIAAKKGEQEVMECLLDFFHPEQEGMTLEEYIALQDKDDNTVMHIAALRGSVEYLELLLEAGGKLSQVGLNGETLLMAAAREGKQEIVKWLLDNFEAETEGMTLQEYIDMKDKQGSTVMLLAAWNSSVKCVQHLLNAGGNLFLVDEEEESSLMIAAREGKQEDLERLLENFNGKRGGIGTVKYVNIMLGNDNTVVYHSAWETSVGRVAQLFKGGRKLTQVDGDTEKASMKTFGYYNLGAVEYLSDYIYTMREDITVEDFIEINEIHGDPSLRGSVEGFKYLVQTGAKLSEGRSNGETLLIEAALGDKLEVVKLIADNFDEVREGMTLQEYIDIKGKDGNTVMHIAAWDGSMEGVKLLLQAGGKLSLEGCFGETPLMKALRNGNDRVVQYLLDNFNDEREGMTVHDYFHIKEIHGVTLLHYAAFGGSVECLKLLLEAGGKLSQVGFDGETSFMAAVLGGRQDVVEWLLVNFNEEREGIALQDYIDKKFKDGSTVLHLAAGEGSVKCVKHLVNAGGKLSSVNDEGETPLMIAAMEGKQEIVECLLDSFNAQKEGMPLQDYIGIKDNYGNTVLHLAAFGGFVECCKPVFKAGGKLSQRAWNGETPLMTAAREGQHDVVKWLLENFNADRDGMALQDYIEMKDNSGDTMLHLAACTGYVECVKLVDKAGGKLSQRGWNGETPLMTAAKEYKSEVVRWLLGNFNAEREGLPLQEYIDLQDKTLGRTALTWARADCRDLIETFREANI